MITLTNDVLKKLGNIGKDLGEFSRETGKMFYDFAVDAGYTIPIDKSRSVSPVSRGRAGAIKQPPMDVYFSSEVS